MGGFIARREPQALLFLAAHRGTYLRLVQMPPGIGVGVLSSLCEKGLVATAPATNFPRERGYAITASGLRWLQDHQAGVGLADPVPRLQQTRPPSNRIG